MGHEEYIRVVEGGRCAVLMIHGIFGTPRHFDCLLPFIPAQWSVYNILLDGHGGTVQDFSRTSMKKWKAQTNLRLKELCKQYETVVVIAHSMGTLLTLHAAPQFPQVKAMLLLNCPLKPWVRSCMIPRLLRIAFNRIDESDIWLTSTRDAAGLEATRKLWLYLGCIPKLIELLVLCKQTQAVVPSITLPCHAFHSRRDELVSVRSARFFQNHPVVHHEMLEHSGHFYYPPEDLTQIAASIQALFTAATQEQGASYDR